MVFLLLMQLASAMASPCVPLAERTARPRLNLWDVRDDQISEVDVVASELRREGWDRVNWHSGIPSEVVLRLADLAAAEGRFLLRCGSRSEDAELWMKRALHLTDYLLQTEAQVNRRWLTFHIRADALCGLGEWSACIEAITAYAAESDAAEARCEVHAWTGDALLSEGDPASAIDAYQRALQDGSGCTYALYGMAWAQQRLGDTEAAIRSMVRLVQTEVPRIEGPRVSAALEAAVLDLPLFRAHEDDERGRSELARLEADIVRALMTPRPMDRRKKRDGLACDVRAFDVLLGLGFLGPGFELVEACDLILRNREHQRRQRRRDHRQQASIRDSLEQMLERIIDVTAQGDEQDPVGKEGPDGALRCRVAHLYLGRFPQAARASEMRRIIGNPVCGAGEY